MTKTAQLDPFINNLAIRCFRDTGDGDYIAARMAYRATLIPQFHWSALQAIEKYLKCILILNRITTHKLNHNIQKALNRINSEAPFKIELDEIEQEVFDHIARYGPDRYLLMSYHVSRLELLKLDKLVWLLRQYCRPMKYGIQSNGKRLDRTDAVLHGIKSSRNEPPQRAPVFNGKLEAILANKKHAARGALIWKNMRFCSRHRESIAFKDYIYAENAPLWLQPQLLQHVKHLMTIPHDILEGYEQYAKEREVS
jgi:HEPN domain-containing protein